MSTAKKINFFHTVLMSITFLAFGIISNGVWAEKNLEFGGGTYSDGSLTWMKSNGQPYTYSEAKDFCKHANIQQLDNLSGWRLPTQTEIETFYLNNLGNENANTRYDKAMIIGLKNWQGGVWATPDEKNDALYYAFLLGQGVTQGCYEGKLESQQEPLCIQAHQAFCVTDEKMGVLWACPSIKDLKYEEIFHQRCRTRYCSSSQLSGRLTSTKGGSVEIIDGSLGEPFNGQSYPASRTIYMRNDHHLSCIYSSSKAGTHDFNLSTTDKAIIGKSCILVGGQVDGYYCNGDGCAIKCPLN